jgi:Ner family transcriptional regulator
MKPAVENVVRPGVGWHHEDIKAELRKRYGSLATFAERLGTSRQSISGVLTNPLASTRLERLIADALEVDPSIIWPMRWRPDGSPISRRLRKSKIFEFHK